MFDAKLEIANSKVAVDYDKPDFYDPSYGFSKESLASVGIFDKGKISPLDIGELDFNQYQKKPAKVYHQQNFAKYSDLGKGVKSVLRSTIPDVKLPVSSGNLNPLKYIAGFDNFENGDSSHSSSREHESVYKTDLIDYEQYFKKLNQFTRPSFAENFKPSKPQDESSGRFIWQAGQDGRPFRSFYDFSKLYPNEGNRYSPDVYEQQRAFGNLINKLANSASYDLANSDPDEEYDSPKTRGGKNSQRGRRPNTDERNKPRGSPKFNLCSGTRCANNGRRPPF